MTKFNNSKYTKIKVTILKKGEHCDDLGRLSTTLIVYKIINQNRTYN